MHAREGKQNEKHGARPGRTRIRVPAFLCAFLLVTPLASAGGSAGIAVLNISAQDERAVIRTADGKTKIVKPGDVIGPKELNVQGSKSRNEGSGGRTGTSAQDTNGGAVRTLTVTEIAEGRVVLEETRGDETETVLIRIGDGGQTVQRIRKTAEQKPEAVAPLSVPFKEPRVGRGKEKPGSRRP